MAANLVKAGYSVAGFDLVPASCATATANGVHVQPSAAEAVAGAEIVITMLPAGKHVISVWSEIMPLLAAGTLLIDCSTIDVESARKAHALAAASRCPSLDAPVSGGTGGATAGTLTFMVGGAPEAFSRGEADPAGDGQAHRPLRRCRVRSGGKDLQQHDPRHHHGRRRRSLHAGRKARACRIRRCSTWHRPRPASAGR